MKSFDTVGDSSSVAVQNPALSEHDRPADTLLPRSL